MLDKDFYDDFEEGCEHICSLPPHLGDFFWEEVTIVYVKMGVPLMPYHAWYADWIKIKVNDSNNRWHLGTGKSALMPNLYCHCTVGIEIITETQRARRN